MFTPTQRKAALSSLLILVATISPAAAQGLNLQLSTPGNIDLGVRLEYLLAKCVEFGWVRITHFLLAVLGAQFLISWALSRLIAGENGTLKNNARYFFLSFFAWVVVVGIAIALAWLGISTGSSLLILLPILAAGLVLLFIAFALPMKIFKIGFLRTLLFVILAGVGSGLAQKALSTRLANPFEELSDKTPEEQARLIAEWQRNRRSASGPTAGGMLLATPENLHRLYNELQQHRTILDPNDTPAVVAYNQKVAQYNIMRAKLEPQFLPKAPAPITPVLPKKRTN